MRKNQRKSLIFACVFGIIITWALLIFGGIVTLNAEITLISGITNGLLIANAVISSMVYIFVIRKHKKQNNQKNGAV